MTRVSGKKINKFVEEKISNQFLSVLNTLPKLSSKKFYFEFLSKTEKIMLIKRMAIIYMLLEKIPYRKISSVLKVSTSTIERIDNDLESGNLNNVKKHLLKKINKEKFWLELEVVFRAGMPEMGKNRWKNVNKLLEK